MSAPYALHNVVTPPRSPNHNSEFQFTWEELVRLYQAFSNFEEHGKVHGETNIIELLKRAEIGPVNSKDIDFFYEVIGLRYEEDPISFPRQPAFVVHFGYIRVL